MAEAEALQMRYLQGPLLRAQGAFGEMTKGVGAGIAKRGGVGQGTNTERIEDQQHGTGHRGFRSNKRSEEHTSDLQSLMRISYAVFCLKKKKTTTSPKTYTNQHSQQKAQHRQT